MDVGDLREYFRGEQAARTATKAADKSRVQLPANQNT
jgi:hypothetical protein